MKNRLEAQMQELMEGAKPDELMPGFDGEAFWKTVADALPIQQKKRRLALRPVAWAAALAGVMVIAWHFAEDKHQAEDQAVVKTMPAAISKQPPVAAASPGYTTLHKSVLAAPVHKDAVISAQPGRAVQQPHPATQLPDAPIVAAPAYETPEPAAVVQQAPARRVVHYLDLDEDEVPPSDIAAAVPHPLIRIRPTRPAIPEGAAAQQPPARDLVLALRGK